MPDFNFTPFWNAFSNASYILTHSVIFTSKSDQWMSEIGVYLGELTNELTTTSPPLPRDDLKNYTFQTTSGKMVSKVRGFILKFRGSQKLNFATMCAQICNPNGEPIYLENPHFIKRDAKSKATHTVKLKKKYNIVYDKRVAYGFNTFPCGYR